MKVNCHFLLSKNLNYHFFSAFREISYQLFIIPINLKNQAQYKHSTMFRGILALKNVVSILFLYLSIYKYGCKTLETIQ